jgi:hypothetical protein
MKKSLLAIAVGTVLLAGAGIASAQTATATATTTTTTWTNEQGTVIREYSTTQKYKPYEDPSFKASIGTTLPGTYSVYPLPPTLTVPQRDTYSYTILNNQPVLVERDTRRIIHVW